MAFELFKPMTFSQAANEIAFAPANSLSPTLRFVLVDQEALATSTKPNEVKTAPKSMEGDGEGRSQSQQRTMVIPFDSTHRLIIGRNRRKCHIVLRHDDISGAHAAIAPSPKAGQCDLIDLTSSNGTFLASHCLAPGEAGRVHLPIGSIFWLARLTLVFVDREALLAYLDL